MDKLDRFLDRLDNFLTRLEELAPQAARQPDWDSAIAHRWRRLGNGVWLQAIRHPHQLRLCDLKNIDVQKERIERNTRQFVAGHPANNVLLWGSRGTGKSSLIKALLNEYADQGLRLIEIDKQDLADLPDIIDLLYDRPERFILFCDDLSFEADDSSYKALKALLDGSLSAAPDNVLLYATSNRRHLLPEYMTENEEARNIDGEIHHGESVEEKISLSERFGLWVSFYPFSQDSYLEIVFHWIDSLGAASADSETVRAAALRYALERGSRSGRVAWQFARDWVGRQALERAR